MASKVEIMNMASLELGDEIIMSEDEDTKIARTMKALWPTTVKECLEDHTWGFAKKRATLAQLTAAPEHGYAYAYQLPADFIRMVYMGVPDDEYDWSIENGLLLTDEGAAEITYIYNVTTPALFSPKFVVALSYLLAAKAANSIAGLDTSKKREMMMVYEKTLMDAETIDSQNSPSPIQKPNRWVWARY
jgi:hypothetical protein